MFLYWKHTKQYQYNCHANEHSQWTRKIKSRQDDVIDDWKVHFRMNVYTEYGRHMIFLLIMTDQMKRTIVITILDATEATPKSCKVKDNFRFLCFLPSFSSFGWGISEEKIKMWKVNGRRTPSDGKSSHCLWQGELKMKQTSGVSI